MAPQAAYSPQPGAQPGTDALPQIKHIVILMMENHSYDNYFGMLTDHGDGFSLGPDGKPVGSNADSSGKRVPLTHSAKTTQHAHVPTQTWHASHIQWNNGAADGFVRGIEQTMPDEDATAAMLYWTESELPFYYGLARTFPLATRWFGSCLGPTFPNRRFLIAGTAHGLIDDLPFDMIDYPENGTILDHLTAHGISWVNYHHLSRIRINWQRIGHAKGLQFFRLLGGAVAGLYPQFRARLESKLVVTADMYPLGYLRALNHIRPIDDFWHAASAGTLPSVTFVDPDFPANSEENPQDIQIGEEFAARVINAVMNGKGWPHTLLVWLYDEHGGYYDHVPPPAAPAPDDVPAMSPYQRYPALKLLSRTSLGRKVTAADSGPQTYTQLGFRVPAVVVSPYAKPGYLSEVVYDHTAILKLIERKWSLPPLTRRDAAAADMLEMLDLESPPAFLDPPVLPKPARAG